MLSGGIAHDFRNSLTAIIGNLSMARPFAEPGSELEKHLEDVSSAAEEARELGLAAALLVGTRAGREAATGSRGPTTRARAKGASGVTDTSEEVASSSPAAAAFSAASLAALFRFQRFCFNFFRAALGFGAAT